MFTFPFGFYSSPASAYNAVKFDGSNDYMNRTSDLTGNADSKQGTVSLWINLNGGDGSSLYFYSATNSRMIFLRHTDNTIRFIARSVLSTICTSFVSSTTVTASSGWTHILASWDNAISAIHLYLNDVESITSVTQADLAIDCTQTEHVVGATITKAGKLNGCMEEFYFNMSEYIDLSVEANRRKFIDAAGNPVDLGADGSTPTGTAPIIYLNGDSTNFQTNQGSGGNFVVTGALEDCATSA